MYFIWKEWGNIIISLRNFKTLVILRSKYSSWRSMDSSQLLDYLVGRDIEKADTSAVEPGDT